MIPHFTLEEKLEIIGACVSAVVVFAVIVVCWACEGLRCRRKKNEDEEANLVKKPIRKLAPCHRVIGYSHLLPAVPAIKVDKLEEKSGSAMVQPRWSLQTTSPPSDDSTKFDSACLQFKFARDSYSSKDFSTSKDSFPTKDSYTSKDSFTYKDSSASCSTASSTASELSSKPARRILHRLRDTRNTFDSDTSSNGEISTQNLPVLEVSLQYDSNHEKLTIYIFRLRQLPANIYGGTSDTYVQIIVGKNIKNYWGRRSTIAVDSGTHLAAVNSRPSSPVDQEQSVSTDTFQKLAEFQTKLARKDVEPLFAEWFVVDGIKVKDRKNASIKFVIHGIDRFCHQCIVGMKQFDVDKASAEIGKFNMILDPFMPNLGEITVSLCYMPTASRLVVRVTSVTNFKLPEGLNVANPYVKGVILRQGKILEERRTACKQHISHLTFGEEPLVYDVPTFELDKIVLLITVCHEEVPSPDHSLLKVPQVNERRRSVDAFVSQGQPLQSDQGLHKSHSSTCISKKATIPLGRIAFGSLPSMDDAPRQHWVNTTANARKYITRTHKLRP